MRNTASSVNEQPVGVPTSWVSFVTVEVRPHFRLTASRSQNITVICRCSPMALPQPPGMMRGMTLAPPDREAIAAEALGAMDDARQIAPFSARYPGLTLDDAYRISARLCALRTARGERVIGRKIGFTNMPSTRRCGDSCSTPRRAISRRRARPARHPFTLAPFAEPRIEPEIVFRLAAAPSCRAQKLIMQQPGKYGVTRRAQAPQLSTGQH
jgi:hypothetical protein